jgi:hypothetical protein
MKTSITAIKNKIIPFGRFTAINLFGIVFYKDRISEIGLNHERIHSAQAADLSSFRIMGWILFYLLYIKFYVINLIKGSEDAYYDIPFEKEAYENQNNLNYINERERFAWVD